MQPGPAESRGLCAVCSAAVLTTHQREKNQNGHYIHSSCSKLEVKGACGACNRPVLSNQARNRDPTTQLYFHASCSQQAQHSPLHQVPCDLRGSLPDVPVPQAAPVDLVRNYDLLNSTDVSDLVQDLKTNAREHKILVIDPSSKLGVSVREHGYVRVSFRNERDIQEVLSHRWGQTVMVNSKEFPVGFLRQRYDKITWVDALTHLNDGAMVEITIETMGKLYATKPCRALYFEQGLQAAWDALVRGWMWQELVPGPQAHRYSDDAVRALHLLYKNRILSGAMSTYVCRNPLDRMYGDPKIQHHVDLERVTKCGCPEDAIEFVSALCRTIGAQAMSKFGSLTTCLLSYDASFRVDEQVQQNLKDALPLLVRADKPKAIDDLVLDAMSHLSCGNYARQDDCVAASFAVLLNMLHQPFSPENVRDLIAANLDRYMELHQLFKPIVAVPGLCNPLGVVKSDTVVWIGQLKSRQVQSEEGVEGVEWLEALPIHFRMSNIGDIKAQDFVQQSSLAEARVKHVAFVAKQWMAGGMYSRGSTTYCALVRTTKGSGFLQASSLAVLRRCLDNGSGALVHGSPCL